MTEKSMLEKELERLVKLEQSVDRLRDDVTELKEDQKEINKKLTELLNLKQRGAGVFWLLSTLMGEVGLIGFVIFCFEHLKKG